MISTVLGNSTSPRLDHIRAHDVDLYELNGIAHIRANGKGISLLTEQGQLTRLVVAHPPQYAYAFRTRPQSRPARPFRFVPGF